MSGERHVDRRLHARLMERVGVSELTGLSRLAPAERRLRVREEALALLREEGELLPHDALTRVVNGIADRVVGFGPIEALLRDPEVTEVMVNGPDDVFVERKGRVERVPDVLFEGEEDVVHVMG